MKGMKISAKKYLTSILLIAAAGGLTLMFVSILPMGSVAQEPNKIILWAEIVLSVSLGGWGIYSLVNQFRN